MLPELCLKKSKTCQYVRKTNDSILYLTGISNVKSEVRSKIIKPEINIANTEKDIDSLFISMINSASELNMYSYFSSKPDLDNPATEMGKHDCYPKNLIISKTNKLFEEKDSIEVKMRGCTCSKIINDCLEVISKVKVNIIRTNLKKINENGKKYEIAYLIANSEACGLYTKLDTGIKMLIRPTGCFKLLFKL